MALTKDGYSERLVDKEIDELLEMFGAVSIEGPKFCGKTWTASNHANSSVLLTKSDNPNSDYQKALISRELIYTNDFPELIDEWQSIPQIWDDVRTKCDQDGKKGKFILTGSSAPVNTKEIFHSGAGRIYKLNMYTMSLYESKDSEGSVSLESLFKGKDIKVNLKTKPTIELLADLIVRGGWPASLTYKKESYYRLPHSYIEDVLDHDINYDGIDRDKGKMAMLLKALARNEATLATNKKLINESNYSISRNTITDYLNVLNDLHMIKSLPPFSAKIRSSIRVGKNSKRLFIDPSLACSLLGLKQEHLINDLETFGFLFESLVLRDLRIYIEYLGGNIYHYHENNTGEEVDAIVELSNGDYGAIEIKLGVGQIEDASSHLLAFASKCDKKPTFLCVISGMIDYAYKRNDNVYVIPITALKP